MIWFLEDFARLAAEKAAIERLVAEVDWLSDPVWGFADNGRIQLKFSIVIGERTYALAMTYPQFFPHTPPDVTPADPQQSLSAHQYGNGNLCLEYRPDNWQPDLTGADLIRSAHRLISSEHPAEGAPQRVPSAHSITKGQELRTQSRRHIIVKEFAELVSGMAESVPLRTAVQLIPRNKGLSAIVSGVTLVDGSTWKPKGVPRFGGTFHGVLVRIDSAVMKWLIDDEVATAAKILRDVFALSFSTPLANYEEREVFIATDGVEIRFYWQLRETNDEMAVFENVEAEDGCQRMPSGYEALADRTVAVIGCGSVGSKVAVSLARSGVGHCMLLNDDILIKPNLVRNDLDWRNIGDHKAIGVAQRIWFVNPAATATTYRIRLTGQEAAAIAGNALSKISECDLIIDATADAGVFNLLSTVVTSSKTPIVWGEVFGGGIGGFVARHRPGADHPPQMMRASLLEWFEKQDAPWFGGRDVDYGAVDHGGAPLVADDGDVSVIAAHLARFAVDCLINAIAFLIQCMWWE